MNLLPVALFDTMDNIQSANFSQVSIHYNQDDLTHAWQFLKSYTGSQGTFNSYRREVERLLHWSALIAGKSLRDIKRDDIEAFTRFCQNPPKSWIGVKKVAKFILKDGQTVPNPAWRPFVVTLSKAAHRKGIEPDPKVFALSSGAIKELFAIISSFYNYLMQEEYTFMNPVALIRQKSKFIQKNHGPTQVRRLSELQWQHVIKTTQELAATQPVPYERHYFIISALYGMYLRISELASTPRWTPKMHDFARDNDGNWWFTTVGKGNKRRQIAVSDAMLNALKRWRLHLSLSALPSPADNSPLLPKIKGKGPITSINHIRKIVQECFDKTIAQLNQENLTEEAESLIAATVHWLRHTGISDDVKIRPREHVRDDAGHSSSATTDRYIDIELRERHASARKKTINN